MTVAFKMKPFVGHWEQHFTLEFTHSMCCFRSELLSIVAGEWFRLSMAPVGMTKPFLNWNIKGNMGLDLFYSDYPAGDILHWFLEFYSGGNISLQGIQWLPYLSVSEVSLVALFLMLPEAWKVHSLFILGRGSIFPIIWHSFITECK